ncbi:MAG: metallopeptidase TldD-related protein [Candidatus Hydrogenedentota bacterium]
MRPIAFCLAAMMVLGIASTADADIVDGKLVLHTRSRPAELESEGPPGIVYKTIEWDPEKTAIIICDVWNTLKGKTAADRVAEHAPRINEVVSAARDQGVLIVHAPSGTLDFYKGTPARQRCIDAPKVETAVPLKWNELDPSREATLPIDDSDGGWEGPVAEGTRPQTRQHPAITITDKDAIGDGAGVFYLLEQQGIENVILTGVHTNMCVLGRPFGIRQLTYLGKNVLLMRDCTDSLYNPEMPPKVSHYRGTDLVIEHIEKYWCPTVTSTDFIDKPPFRFEGDHRKHVVFFVSDDHYDADKTLPVFAQQLREAYDLHCTVLHGEGRHELPLVETLQDADALIIFVRRLGLPEEQLRALQKYVNGGNPTIGMRTASHAFTMNFRDPPGFEVPEGRAEWREFDAEVLGGNYHNHAANELGTDVAIVEGKADHPIFKGVTPAKWHSTGSLYFTSPVKDDAEVLMTGSIPDRTEPLLWTRRHNNGKVVYMGLGHPDDFEATTANAGLIAPHPWNVVVSPGDSSLEDMIREVDHGLLVTNVWYTRFQNYHTGDFSTIPRDAAITIDNGELGHAVTGIRISDSLPRLLTSITRLSRKQQQIHWWEARKTIKKIESNSHGHLLRLRFMLRFNNPPSGDF